MIISNCCGYPPTETYPEEMGICPRCHDHCVWEDDEKCILNAARDEGIKRIGMAVGIFDDAETARKYYDVVGCPMPVRD